MLIGPEATHRGLILLSEGMTGHHGAVVRGAYGVGGASVKLVGGCAGDELALTKTWQFHGGAVHSGCATWRRHPAPFAPLGGADDLRLRGDGTERSVRGDCRREVAVRID